MFGFCGLHNRGLILMTGGIGFLCDIYVTTGTNIGGAATVCTGGGGHSAGIAVGMGLLRGFFRRFLSGLTL